MKRSNYNCEKTDCRSNFKFLISNFSIQMRSFFSGSYYLWVVLRILFVIAGLVSLFQIWSEERLDFVESSINFIFFIFIILMTICAVKDIRGIRRRSVINRVAGVVSIFIALSIVSLVLFINPGRLVVPLIVPVLFSAFIFMLGLFDIIGPEIPEEILDGSEI